MFRDDYAEYQRQGIVILGISPDPVDSHRDFKAKNELPFTLLADTERKVLRLYEAWGNKTIFGKLVEGVLRTTYVIGPDGVILRAFESVKADGHSQEVLATFRDYEEKARKPRR